MFFFLRLPSFSEKYKTALCFTGLVTFIAMYHYFRIFESFVKAYTPCEVVNGTINPFKCSADKYGWTPTGHPFNDAYRYVDWLLTVPLLLIEIVLVMNLPEEETYRRSTILGVASALMIVNGYPGEITSDPHTRWVFWFLSMVPFVYIVYTLFVGLKDSQDSQPEAVRDQVRWACWATVFSWCTYPIVFIFPMLSGSETGKSGLSATSMVAIQVGYTFSDIISKCGVGFLVYRIGLVKSQLGQLGNNQKHFSHQPLSTTDALDAKFEREFAQACEDSDEPDDIKVEEESGRNDLNIKVEEEVSHQPLSTTGDDEVDAKVEEESVEDEVVSKVEDEPVEDEVAATVEEDAMEYEVGVPMDSVVPKDEPQVLKVMDKRQDTDGMVEYHVLWNDGDKTWEKLEDLEGQKAIHEWENKGSKAKENKQKGKKKKKQKGSA